MHSALNIAVSIATSVTLFSSYYVMLHYWWRNSRPGKRLRYLRSNLISEIELFYLRVILRCIKLHLSHSAIKRLEMVGSDEVETSYVTKADAEIILHIHISIIVTYLTGVVA